MNEEKDNPIEVMPDIKENIRAECAGDEFLSQKFLEFAGVEGYSDEMEALRYVSNEDVRKMVAVEKAIGAELKSLYTDPEAYMAEHAKAMLYDDEIRHKTISTIFLVSVIVVNQIGLTSFTSEYMKFVSAASPVLDSILNYLYEVNSTYGKLDVYNENDSAVNRQRRNEMFIGKTAYHLLNTAIPNAVDDLIAILEKANQGQLKWEAEHATR